jgi:hypothetical protein
MSNKPDTEEKGRLERKAREKHHGVGRAGLSQSDRALPTEVEGHQGVGAQGEENLDRSLAADRRDHAKRTMKPGQGNRSDVKR